MKRRPAPSLTDLDFVSPQSVTIDDATSNAETGNWMVLVPKGRFHGRDGRGPYDAGDTAAMQALIANTKAIQGGTDVMVDYDHQLMFGAVAGVGGTAKAAGWVTDYRVTDRGIEGRVEWTEAAQSAIRSREYRYLSPVFRHSQAGKISSLHSVGLVNAPNLDLEAVAAFSSLNPQGEDMLEEIAKALGLEETASKEAILLAINASQADRSKIAQAAGLAATATGAEVLVAVQSAGKGQTVDPTRYVPIEQVTAMQATLTSLQEGIANREATEAVDAAIAAGKLTPAMRDWGLSCHKADAAQFRTFVDKAPVLTEPQLGNGRVPPANTEPTIGATELAVMSQMGVSREDFVAAAKTLAGGAR